MGFGLRGLVEASLLLGEWGGVGVNEGLTEELRFHGLAVGGIGLTVSNGHRFFCSQKLVQDDRGGEKMLRKHWVESMFFKHLTEKNYKKKTR